MLPINGYTLYIISEIYSNHVRYFFMYKNFSLQKLVFLYAYESYHENQKMIALIYIIQNGLYFKKLLTPELFLDSFYPKKK